MILHGAAGEAAPFSALPNGASAVSGHTEEQERTGAKVALEDLFKDVWMAEEEEPEPQAATPDDHVPDAEVSIPAVTHFVKEKFTLFSNHNGSLLRRQPGATCYVG